MKTYIGKILFVISFLLSGFLKVHSQCPVVINEVMVSPTGGINENCFYNADTLNGGNPNLGLEWIELYNANPCDSFDISCYMIAFETSSGTGQNYGSFKLFGVIPPNGHFLIGGSNVPNADINTSLINALHCSSKKWCLNDSAGWIGFYDINSFPIDAVYWNIGGTAADLYTWPQYTSDIETPMPYCSCCTSSYFENPGTFAVAEYAGNVIPNSSITFARITDGNPVWGFGPVGGTPNNCNGGSCNSVSIGFTLNPPTCVGGNNGSVSVNMGTTTTLQTPFTYKWSNNDTGQTISGLTAGLYRVTVTDKWGCEYIADTILNNPTPPDLSILCDNPVCPGDDVTLNSNISGITYNWTGPDSFSSSFSSPVITAFQQINEGNYYLTILNSDSCILKDTLQILLKQLPVVNIGNDTNICYHQSLKLNADNGNNFTYLWSDGSTLPQNTIVADNNTSGLNPFWVSVLVTVPNCISISDSILITLEQCEVEETNVITPNNDNINDNFVFKGLDKFPNSQLVIFNRWGRIIYENSDYQNDWNGNSCPDGVYYYILKLSESSDRKEIKGWITIIGKEN